MDVKCEKKGKRDRGWKVLGKGKREEGNEVKYQEK